MSEQADRYTYYVSSYTSINDFSGEEFSGLVTQRVWQAVGKDSIPAKPLQSSGQSELGLGGQASGVQPGPLNYFLNRAPSCIPPPYLSVFPSTILCNWKAESLGSSTHLVRVCVN
ncbi:Immunoglobulin superfamily member 3 [Clarias magur]|nr:Immunoglobulin superfamily member 3 [Clarias magur]